MNDVLSAEQLQQFITDGFVRIDHAFSPEIAREARQLLWRDTGCDPADPSTWTQPVVRLGMYHQPPFVQAANTPRLHQAFDALVGPGRWLPCRSMGTFPVRFPSAAEPGDTGWHVDTSFPGADPADYFSWRANVRSRGRALLMLFLFSDVSELDAPTRLRRGSHRDVARWLAPAGEAGLSFMELAARLPELPPRPEALATGPAGTVYLCHPFLAHAAQPHHGTEPRFMAQPPLFLRDAAAPNRPFLEHELRLTGASSYSPVEEAIRLALPQA